MNTALRQLANGLRRRPRPPVPPSLLLEETLYRRCLGRMKKGSLSFFTAARLLGHHEHRAIAMLYAWCRYCDDQIDGQNLGHRDALLSPLLHPTGSPENPDRDNILDRLMVQTKSMMTDRKAFREAFSQSTLDPALVAMGYLAHHRGLPYFYAEELLKGMAMDLTPPHYQTIKDLKVYGYHVAGVVGVMFTYLVGLSTPSARAQAADLGIAMQLTNIARDIIDDAYLGRIYLPRSLLIHYGLPQEPQEFLKAFKNSTSPTDGAPLAPENQALPHAVRDLLKEADRLYEQAGNGLKYLPWRAAWAAASARFIYQSIGDRILAKKAKAWETRCSVSTATKIWGVAKGLLLLAKDFPYRLRHPWKLRLSHDYWRYLDL